MDERRITRWCQALLDAAAAGIDSQGYPVPALQFISPGLPAWDTEMLCVSFESFVPTQGLLTSASAAPIRALFQNSGLFLVWMIVAAPLVDVGFDGPTMPLAEELGECAEDLYARTLAVRDGILAPLRRGEYGPGAPIAFVDGRIVGPEGGLVACLQRWQVDLTVAPVLVGS